MAGHIGQIERVGPPGTATAALVLGIATLITGLCGGVGVVLAPFAILFGVIGLTQCRDLEVPGKDRCWFGIISGTLVLLIVLTAIGMSI